MNVGFRARGPVENGVAMKEQLSAFMDDELGELEGRRVLDELARDPDLRETWERYHLIQAAFRRELELASSRALPGRIQEALARAPDIRAGRRWPAGRRLAGGVAIAATVAAVALFGLQTFTAPNGQKESPVAASPAGSDYIRAGATRWDTPHPEVESTLNAYLVEHSEFSPATGMGGMMPYVRVVGYDSGR
jgi:sigma-E factor negative regulatory protein RseA